MHSWASLEKEFAGCLAMSSNQSGPAAGQILERKLEKLICCVEESRNHPSTSGLSSWIFENGCSVAGKKSRWRVVCH